MRRLIPPLHEAMKDLLPLIDRDTRAFDAYLAAVGLPKDTAEEKAARHAGDAGRPRRPRCRCRSRSCASGDRCWDAMVEMAAHGNPASRSDLEVGAKALEAGIWGAWRNVAINLARDRGRGVPRGRTGEAEALAERAAAKCDEVLAALAVRKG